MARFGSGTPIVCVPLLRELNFVYAPHIDALSPDHEVVLYEPVVSRSRHISVAARVDELHSVLDTLGLPAAHLLAWSDGAPWRIASPSDIRRAAAPPHSSYCRTGTGCARLRRSG